MTIICYGQPMHKDIQTFLSERGLTDTEVQLYVLGLGEKISTASDLAKKSGLKRTTVYSALASLEQKGLTGSVLQGSVRAYAMVDPSLLEQQLEEAIEDLQAQKQQFAEVLPLFEKLSGTGGVDTLAQQFQGEAGVRTAVDMALFCRSRQWKIISPAQNYFSQTDPEYAAYFIKTRKQRKISAQSLWEPAFVTKRKFSQSTLDTRNPRVLPRQYANKFQSVIILFDTKVLFVNSMNELSAVVIESPEISATIHVLFDGLWSHSNPIAKSRIRVTQS